MDTVLTRIMDALMSAPSLVLAITIVAVLGSGITNAMLAVGLVMPRAVLPGGAGLDDGRPRGHLYRGIGGVGV